MPEVTVTLVRHFKQEGTNAKGAWTRHDFKDADGNKYQTFEAALANRAYGLLNQPAVVTYEDVKRGDYTNRVIKGISPKGISDSRTDEQSSSSVETPQAVSVAPVASEGPPARSFLAPPDDRQVQIMRQSALERAIRYAHLVGGGVIDVYATSEEFLHYFQTGEYPGKPSNEQAVLAEFASQFPGAA